MTAHEAVMFFAAWMLALVLILAFFHGATRND